MRYFVDVSGQALELVVEPGADGSYRVRSADDSYPEVSVRSLQRDAAMHTVLVGNQVLEVRLHDGQVRLGEARFTVHAESERERAAKRSVSADARTSKELVAPMPGRIVRVSCAAGAAVAKGTPLIVIEAMKMQNELYAKADGVVRAVRVKDGDTVERGAVLLELE